MTSILSIALNPTVDLSCDAQQVVPTRKTRTHNQKYYPGGGGVNVARVVAELGGAVDLLYMSGGATGTILDECLAETRIQCQRVQIAAQTRLSFTVHDKTNAEEYRFVPEGPMVDGTELDQMLDSVQAFDGQYVVVSGSLPPGVPPDIYARIAQIAKRQGVRFVLDSSGEGLRRTIEKAPVFLMKPNIRELEFLVGRPLGKDDAQQAAQQLVADGAADNIVVSLGGEGAFLVTATSVKYLPAKEVTVRSAVGAGDSFLGAMTFSLAAGHPMETAFLFGVAAGASAVMTPGTELCHREDVFRFFEELETANRA